MGHTAPKSAVVDVRIALVVQIAAQRAECGLDLAKRLHIQILLELGTGHGQIFVRGSNQCAPCIGNPRLFGSPVVGVRFQNNQPPLLEYLHRMSH